MKKAIYPGSFDPFHKGHLSIYKKALKLFDEVIIYVTNNDQKQNQTSLTERAKAIKAIIPNCKIIAKNNLTVSIANENDALYIVRGLRSFEEIQYELLLASINKILKKDLETIIIFSEEDYKNISSSKIKSLKEKYNSDFEKLNSK